MQKAGEKKKQGYSSLHIHSRDHSVKRGGAQKEGGAAAERNHKRRILFSFLRSNSSRVRCAASALCFSWCLWEMVSYSNNYD